MPITSPDSIYYADTGTADSTASITAAMATSVQDAFDNRRQQLTFKWANAAARAAQTGMAEGDVGDQADTNQRWRYSGTAWVDITSGIVPIVPTSISGTGVTMATDGKITFSATTSMSINGCFTSAYSNYMLKLVNTSSSATVSIRMNLRVAGVDAATAYDRVSLYGQNSVAGSAPSINATFAELAAGVMNTINIDVNGPAVAAPTMAFGPSFSTPNPGTAATIAYSNVGFLHRTSTAYDGFTITISGGNATGTLRIYGYN